MALQEVGSVELLGRLVAASAKLGYGAVAINCVYVFVGLLALYAVVIALDRALAGRLPRG